MDVKALKWYLLDSAKPQLALALFLVYQGPA